MLIYYLSSLKSYLLSTCFSIDNNPTRAWACHSQPHKLAYFRDVDLAWMQSLITATKEHKEGKGNSIFLISHRESTGTCLEPGSDPALVSRISEIRAVGAE